MYEAILKAIGGRPAPYAPMALPFWDDPYIARQMLAAHIDPDGEAATRNAGFVRRSADWIATLARGALLDLGCGPGIYGELFAERGFRVTGVDLSAGSIAHAQTSAREKGFVIDYRAANYLDIDFNVQFDVVVLIYCDYGVLAPDDRARVLRNAYRALKPGGLFVVDAWTARQYDAFAERMTISYHENGGFWSAETHAEIKRLYAYPGGVYLERYHIITGGELRTYNIWNRSYDERTLGAELAAAGFGEITFYGDVAGAPRTERDPTICAVAKNEHAISADH